jgi:RND family efflux transporter MFP subunit
MKINPAKQQAALAADVAGLQAAQATQDSAEAELEALKAERVSQEAELKLQEQEFQRISGLVTEGALERQRLDQVSRDRTQAAADLTAIDRRIQAAQAQLAQAKRVVQQNQAQASLVQENLQDTDVTAPFDGVVGDIPLRVGSYVERSDFLTQLVQNSVLELRLFIPLEQIDQLQLDLPVQVQNSAEQPIATGRITFISPQVDTNSQTVLAKATFDNLSDNLRDQQFVRAIVIWSQKGNAVMIPTNALVLQGDDRFVYGVKGKDPFLATLKPVQVGEMKTDQVEILSGLNPGEQIIISGKQKIFDGAPIVPLPNP